MLHLRFLAATSVLALTVGAANADAIFDVSGAPVYVVGTPGPAQLSPGLGGTITINTTTGVVTGADLTLPGFPDFTDITDTGVSAGTSVLSGGGSTYTPVWQLLVGTPGFQYYCTTPSCTDTSKSVFLEFESAGTAASPTLVGFSGGPIYYIETDRYDTALSGIIIDQCPGGDNFPTVSCGAVSLTPSTPTPSPATLPLFATGLSALGLLGWRRKPKAQAAA